MTYAIKNLKTFLGHEGEPLAQGSLHGPSGKVATWSDGDWGGPMSYHFNAGEEEKFVVFARQEVGKYLDYDKNNYDEKTMSNDDVISIVINEMTEQLLLKKDAEKYAKKGIAYFIASPTSPGGRALYSTATPYTKKNVDQLRAQVPGLLEIVNETMGMAFIDAGEAAKAARFKRLQKLCKTETVIVMRNEDGTTRDTSFKAKYSEAVKTKMLMRYGDSIVEFFNERFI